MTQISSDKLKHLLERLPAHLAHYGSIFGVLAIASSGPEGLASIVGNIGAGALTNIIERILKSSDVIDDDALQSIESALREAAVQELLTRDDFVRGYIQLVRKLDDQAAINRDILDVVRSGLSSLATVSQLDEVKQLIRDIEHCPSTAINLGGNIQGENVNIAGTQHIHITNYALYVSNETNTSNSDARESVIDAFRSASHRLSNIRASFATDASKQHISLARREVSQLIDWINLPDTDNRLAIILGKPGQGKSVVMQQLTQHLRDRDCIVLGIKADDLAGVSKAILSLDDLSKDLQLPFSVEECVKIVASSQSCIILIDQLDSLALTLNTDEQSLRVVINLIERLRSIKRVKLIVSCRNFERYNDPVLAGIKVDKTFQLTDLEVDEINEVLRQVALPEVQQFPNPLQRLLATPLYLDLYVQLVTSGDYKDLTQISSHHDLYKRLWALRIERPDQNAPPPEQRRRAVYHLVELMQQKRKLKVHIAALDNFSEERYYLQRVGFITEEGHNISFFHQTLFSYCYGRKFVSEQISLSNEIFSSPQGFFERQLMAEVVQHLRSANQDDYSVELNNLLFPANGQSLRYHLRLLLLDLLAWQPNPVDQEYDLVIRLQRTAPDDFQRFLQRAGNSDGWFQRLKRNVAGWLASTDDKIISITLEYLYSIRNRHTAFVVNQVKPYLDRSKAWNHRITRLLRFLADWNDCDDGIDLLIHLIRKGELTIRESHYALSAMAHTNPFGGCKLLVLHCEMAYNNYLNSLPSADNSSQILSNQQSFRDILDTFSVREFMSIVCTNNPQAILDHLFPWFIRVNRQLAEYPLNSLSYRYQALLFTAFDTTSDATGVSLPKGILEALIYLAKSKPIEFRQKIAEMSPVKAYNIQRFLLQAFQANPGEYLLEIYDFLTEEIQRVDLRFDASPLLGAAFKHADDVLRSKWEEFIFRRPKVDLKGRDQSLKAWRDEYKNHQAKLYRDLCHIDEELLSEFARKKKYELRRLPHLKDYNPLRDDRHIYSEARRVQSPVATNKLSRLSPGNWLKIMRKYNDDTDGDARRTSRRFLEGGVVELARAVIEQAKIAPEKFYRIAQHFDDSISVRYITAIVQGLTSKESQANPEWIFDIFHRFHSRLAGGARIDMAKALTQIADVEIPDDIIQIILKWAKDDPDPNVEREHQNIPHILKETSNHTDGWINRAINSVRGVALENVCRVLFQRTPPPLERIYAIIQDGLSDECASVRVLTVEQILRWYNITFDRERLVHLLDSTLIDFPELLTAHPIHSYLYWLSFNDPERALPYVVKMLNIPHEHTQYTAAQIICYAGLYEKKGFEELSHTLHQNPVPSIRWGTAEVYAKEIVKSEKTLICSERLLDLMSDTDENVLIASTRCFDVLHVELFQQLEGFFRQFIMTPAVHYGGAYFIEYLTRIDLVTLDEQKLSLSLMRALLDKFRVDGQGMGDGFWRLQEDATLYLRNAYDKTINDELRKIIMDLFDEMLHLGSEEAQKILQAEDRELSLS